MKRSKKDNPKIIVGKSGSALFITRNTQQLLVFIFIIFTSVLLVYGAYTYWQSKHPKHSVPIPQPRGGSIKLVPPPKGTQPDTPAVTG